MSRYQRYSHHARRALAHASQLAGRYQHPYNDTGHMLVGVILAEGSIGSAIMLELDLPPQVAEVYLKRLLPPAAEPVEQTAPDEAFAAALATSADEANWLGHHYIGTEHLLLGITRANVGYAPLLLRLVGITAEQIRRRVRRALHDGLTEFSLETARRNARLSELTRRVLIAAEQRAVALDHPTVGLGHLLAALLQEQRGITAGILEQSGLDIAQLLAGLEARDPVLLTSVENLLDAAPDQAGRLGSHYIGTDHLLLTMASIIPGIALLQRYGADPDKVQRLLNRQLRRE